MVTDNAKSSHGVAAPHCAAPAVAVGFGTRNGPADGLLSEIEPLSA